jgi:phosphate transport system substrate-binding protein
VKRTSARRAAVPGIAALALTLTLSACGASNESGSDSGDSADGGESLSGTLAGAGASSMERAQEAWITTYQGQNPDVTITYDPVGSGDGRTQFNAGGVSYAGSDAYLDDEEGELSAAAERCGGEAAIEIPAYVSPIAVVFNVDGVDELTLDAPTLGGIFAGDITEWNDPAIAELNPDADLPSGRITPVHRADDSGTTENFTDWMFQASDGAWSEEADGVWPVQGGEAGDGTAGVIAAVTNGTNTIGYADLSQAGDLPTVNIEVAGESVEPTPEAAAAILEASERVPDREDVDMAFDINRDPEDADAYPIVLVSYVLACQTYEDANEADLVKSFLTYVVSEEGQEASAEEAGSAPLSPAIADEATGIIENISAQG